MKQQKDADKLVGIMTRVTPEEREKAQKKAKDTGLSVAAILRKLLVDWENDNQIRLSF
jgi:hypothetical protein